MEETNANVQLKLNELQHCHSTPNQSVKKEVTNVSITAEKITENPEYMVMQRSVAVQTVTNEEIVISKLNPALNQSTSLAVASSEDGNNMELDVSSQESVMDIASQESLCNAANAVSLGEKAELMQEEDVKKRMEDALRLEKVVREREEAVLAREGNVQKREENVLAREKEALRSEEALLECKDRLKFFKECFVNQERILLDMQMGMQEFQKILNAQFHLCNSTVSVSAYGDAELQREEDVRTREGSVVKREVGKRHECKGRENIFNNDVTNRKRILSEMKTEIEENWQILDVQNEQIADRELTLQKLDIAVKIRELEAKGFKVISPRSGQQTNNHEDDCLPAKRAKKS